jgi:hypothetical protein
MSVTPSPIGGFAAQFFDNNGVILSGGKIYTYAAGTTTPQASYTSALGITPHSNPIILDSAGRVPGGEIWLTDGLVYKFVIETATSILIGTYDNITGVNSNFVNYTVQEEVITATAGQTVFNLSTINYTPGTNSLTVYIDGVNQYVGDSYLETDSDTVTFTSGVHVGGEVKFTTAVQSTSGAVNASIVSFTGFNGQTGVVQDLADDDGSDWIGFKQAGAGTVARSAQDKMRDAISVKDFGAVGDGVADDTAAIQATIDVVAPTGGQIVLPPGVYKISSPLNISSQNVFVQGSGRRATKIVQSVVSQKAFNVTAPYFAISSLSIEYASQGTSGGAAISLSGAFYSAVDDIYIYRAYIGVDFINGSNSNQLTRIVCEDCTYVGISILNSVNVIASTFQILNSNTTLCSLGCIRMYGPCEGNNFFNGHTYQGAFSLTTDGPSYTMGNRPSYNKFHGIYLDASAGGALIDKTVELDFIDCWFSTRPGSGASLVQVDGIRFTGGGALNCDQNGVVVEALAKRVVFKNFMSRSNSVASPNTYDGIVFAPNTTDFVVQGCTLTNDTITFGTQKYGVHVLAGTSDRYVIADNLVAGNGTAGVADGGTGLNKRVANNY